MITIETECLVLRPWREEDLQGLYDYAKDPAVGPTAGWPPHESIEESREILSLLMKAESEFAVTLKDTGALIGGCGIKPDGYRAEKAACCIGYVIKTDCKGQGYATEAAQALIDCAFEKWDAPIVAAYHFPHNPASGRVMQKCGMQCDGILRRSHKQYDGQIFDDCVYSITREEWESQKEKS